MKIYTKGGDAGETGLVGGARVSKTDLRIEALGTLDELNACLGVARALGEPLLDVELDRIQAELFSLGAQVATPPDDSRKTDMDLGPIEVLEGEIDCWSEALPPLRNFILPGGTKLAAHLHLARTICRRAERVVSRLPEVSHQPNQAAYLNRLSDWLFMAARWANHSAHVEDVLWRGNR